ncbi:BMP family ABC transporter substrate-binding protein [Peptoniphilus sp. BV3AC2]|uniref:BMP family ABC transporter substrate-binding protein n=1 Tax=Peptoniphilus sp. BV3AC2 TaxID=1111133 RepID=UPI0003B8828A|nr:BMP family ABC transporter substrate-binding protein [Peptoniphilus sp. BV3AC2]ERT64569.1 basic membrane protein [Peptoniphilus sp. BV3AC2]
MKRKIALLLAVLMLATTITACGNKTGNEKANANAGKAESGEAKKKIALVTDPAGTQVFVLNMIAGLKDAAEELGFEPIVVECADAAAFEENTRALVEEKVDLIIGGGWPSGEAINKIASEFPDGAKYALIDSEVEAENVKCISFREQEGAYLIGMIAAMVTEPDEQFFGGVHVNQGVGSWKWRYGFMEGAKSIKPDSKFVFNYTGSFNEPAKAKEFAIQQYEQGARFINAAAAGGDKGVFEAALEKGFYTSGQDIDLTNPDNKYIVSSQIKDSYATVKYLVKQFMEQGDNWKSDNEEWGLEEGTIGAVYVTHESKNPRSDRLTDEDIAKLKEAAEKIKSGELDLKTLPKEEDYK